MARDARMRPSVVIALVITIATVAELAEVDWQALAEAGRATFGHDGLHVYALRSGLQAGPLSLPLLAGLDALGLGRGQVIAHVLLWLAGLAGLRLATSTSKRPDPTGTTDTRLVPITAIGALAVLPLVARLHPGPLPAGLLAAVAGIVAAAWRLPQLRATIGRRVELEPWHWLGLLLVGPFAELAAGSGHLDDGLAITLGLGALWCARSNRQLAAAVALGLAIAAKPWAVVGLPLLLRRGEPVTVIRDLAVATAIPVIAFAPFILADHGTLRAASQPFPIVPVSTVHLFGLHDSVSPHWLRSVQLLGSVLAALVARRRGRADVLAAGLTVRLLLDPATFAYYTASAVLAVGAGDLVARRSAWRTALMSAGLWLVPLVTASSTAIETIRAATLLVLLASYLVASSRAGKPLAGARIGRNRLARDDWSGATGAGGVSGVLVGR